MSFRAALVVVSAAGLAASAGCTLDHEIGMTLTGGSGGGFCGGNASGGGIGAGGGSGATPIDECNPMLSGACTPQGQHCVLTLDAMCPGLCRGWCLPLQTPRPTMCGTGLPICPVGMACLKDPIASCDPFMACGCQGVCYGVNLQASSGIGASCAPDGGPGCSGTDHCVADPAGCEADAGSCAGVCLPSSQPLATACGPWPDFGCPSGTHCVKNPNHDCALPLDCPGLCWPN